MTETLWTAYALAHIAPDFRERLTPAQRLVLPYRPRIWLRPEQLFPAHDWRTLTFLCGRAWGKTRATACQINARVESGIYRSGALMGPTDDRVDEVQIRGLIETAPPWFRPVETKGGLVWPNGVRFDTYTAASAISAERPRSGDYDFGWACEVGAWPRATCGAAWENLKMGVRKPGGPAQLVVDTTSKGKANSVLVSTLEENRVAPRRHIIVNGSTWDNPLLGRKYLDDAKRMFSGQRFAEEIEGKVFLEAAGALWDQDLIDTHRRAIPPEHPEIVLVSLDPAISDRITADEVGIVVGARGRDGHAYILDDASGRHLPDAWAKIVVDRCTRDACGVVIERNAGGVMSAQILNSEAKARGMKLVQLTDAQQFRHERGVIFYREVWARASKGSRGEGPRTEGGHGRVHMCGTFEHLEDELTTFEPDTAGQRSPNRFDAFNWLVIDLAGLDRERPADGAAGCRDAADMHEALKATLRGGGRGRLL